MTNTVKAHSTYIPALFCILSPGGSDKWTPEVFFRVLPEIKIETKTETEL